MHVSKEHRATNPYGNPYGMRESDHSGYTCIAHQRSVFFLLFFDAARGSRAGGRKVGEGGQQGQGEAARKFPEVSGELLDSRVLGGGL